jgi:predicted MFS family arabinose efflux permease
VLTGAFGWHSIFTVNLPLSLLTAVLVFLWTPKDAPQKITVMRLFKEFDVIGLLLFSATLFALMTFLMHLSTPLWWVLAATIVLGVALVMYSLRRRDPFLDVPMLQHNIPLIVTYVRACALATILYCVIYGFSQWLESGVGFSSAQAGLIMLPMSAGAGLTSFLGGRAKGLRLPFILSIGTMLAACLAFAAISGGAPAWVIAAAAVLFGLPQGMFAVTTQAAVYIQAPANEIGAAAGLQRTAFYLGAIIAASVLGLVYGTHATNAGFLDLTIVMGVLCAILLIFTIFDRTLPRGHVS